MLELAPNEYESQTEREQHEKELLGEDEPTTDEASAERAHQDDVETALNDIYHSVRQAKRLGITSEEIYTTTLDAILWKPQTQKG